MLREGIVDETVVEYVYSYLLTHKEDVLVPYMKGAANVSLNTTRLGKIRVPFPILEVRKKIANDILGKQREILKLRMELKLAIDEFDTTVQRVRNYI
ncbi:MAG: restriction endonuclease subunit S, partial [Advenella sp.]|nr:restriction endonuclease subunit S [Advenella sp.]